MVYRGKRNRPRIIRANIFNNDPNFQLRWLTLKKRLWDEAKLTLRFSSRLAHDFAAGKKDFHTGAPLELADVVFRLSENKFVYEYTDYSARVQSESKRLARDWKCMNRCSWRKAWFVVRNEELPRIRRECIAAAGGIPTWGWPWLNPFDPGW